MRGTFKRCFVLLASLLWTSVCGYAAPSVPAPPGEGSRAFVARPVFGAAVFNLPATVRWHTTAAPGGYKVALDADVSVQSVLANIKQLSAKALDRNPPCADAVRVQGAAAKLIAVRALTYNLAFHFIKRVCAGSLPVELPADVTCAARIVLSATRAIITVDVQGVKTPPCVIVGAYTSVSDAIMKLQKRNAFRIFISGEK